MVLPRHYFPFFFLATGEVEGDDGPFCSSSCSFIAIFTALKDSGKINDSSFHCVAGHSLGEYSALVAGNYINIADASILIKNRGELMHSSIKPNISGMAAIIGKNSNFVDDV